MGIFCINIGDERNYYVIYLVLFNFLMVDYIFLKEVVYIKVCSFRKYCFLN